MGGVFAPGWTGGKFSQERGRDALFEVLRSFAIASAEPGDPPHGPGVEDAGT
jgi:hypothetical protein